MTTGTFHPSGIDLEAFACGETTDAVERHLEDCAACARHVDRLRGALSGGPSRARAKDAVARAASLAQPRAARRRWLLRASTVAVPLAAAAALVLLLRTPSTRDVLVPPTGGPSGPAATTPATVTSPKAPETTFKGGIQVAVVRERAGRQVRFTNAVSVRPGDRLRVEVALDREQPILAAVMGEDASWLELMPDGVRAPGTHFSERSARVDAAPMRGTILVGAPDAVQLARQTKRFEGVATVRVEWEAP